MDKKIILLIIILISLLVIREKIQPRNTAVTPIIAPSTIYFTDTYKLKWEPEWESMIESIFRNQDCKFFETGFRCEIVNYSCAKFENGGTLTEASCVKLEGEWKQ